MSAFFSIKEVFKTRSLVIMAMMAALSGLMTTFDIYITPTQRLFVFDYLPRALVAMYLGPWAALMTAFVSDFIGAVVFHPQYGYFFGYAVSSMTADFFCALLLFNRKELKIWRVALWRLLVMVVVVFGLNGLWMRLQYGTTAASYFNATRIIRNLVQYPLDIFLTVFLGRYMRRFFIKN